MRILRSFVRILLSEELDGSMTPGTLSEKTFNARVKFQAASFGVATPLFNGLCGLIEMTAQMRIAGWLSRNYLRQPGRSTEK